MDRRDAAREVPVVDPGEAGIGDHRGEAGLVGELADRLDQIAVGVAIAGDHLAKRRDDVEGEEVVEPVETGDVVSRGERLGRISNAYGGTPATIHLHFEIRAAFVAGDAELIAVPVPPYATLVDAYARLAAGDDGGEGA